MTTPHARTDHAGRNYGTPAPLKFCPECGQETTLHPPTLGEFLHEFVGHYVALEGQLWRTLGLLLARPGRLTREYLDGRRRRYVLPLRLYLTASFVFFLVLKFAVTGALNPGMEVLVNGKLVPIAEYHAQLEAAREGAVPASGPRFEVMRTRNCGGPGERACNRLEAALNASFADLQEHPQEALAHLREHFIHWAPYAIFLLLPAFAGLLQLVYAGRGMTYGEHFVFSMHLHAFWFLAGIVLVLVPSGVAEVGELAVLLYGVWAMRETYRGGWVSTVLRALLVSVLYAIVLGLAMVAMGMALMASN